MALSLSFEALDNGTLMSLIRPTGDPESNFNTTFQIVSRKGQVPNHYSTIYDLSQGLIWFGVSFSMLSVLASLCIALQAEVVSRSFGLARC